MAVRLRKIVQAGQALVASSRGGGLAGPPASKRAMRPQRNKLGALSGSVVHGCCRRWARWDAVNLGSSGVTTLQASVTSPTGGLIEYHIDAPDGPLLGAIFAMKGDSGTTRSASPNTSLTGIHAVYAVWPGRDVSMAWWKP